MDGRKTERRWVGLTCLKGSHSFGECSRPTRRWLNFPKKPSVVHSFSVTGELMNPPPTLWYTVDWLDLKSSGLMQATTTPVSSWAHPSCHVQKALYGTVLPDVWLFTSFLPPLVQWSLCLMKWVWHRWSICCSAPWPVSSVCVNYCSMHKETPLMRPGGCTNLWVMWS